MRTIERDISWAAAFKRDFKREKKKDRQLEFTLGLVLSLLVNDEPFRRKQFGACVRESLQERHVCSMNLCNKKGRGDHAVECRKRCIRPGH